MAGRSRAATIAAVAGGVLALAAPPALAGYVFEVGSEGRVFPRSKSVAYVPVTVECPPDDGATSSQGTTTLSLRQAAADGSETVGTGSIAVVCDNVSRSYEVPVSASSGAFRRGPATVSGTTTFPQTMCIEHPEHGVSCEPAPMTMVVGDRQINLIYRSV